MAVTESSMMFKKGGVEKRLKKIGKQEAESIKLLERIRAGESSGGE